MAFLLKSTDFNHVLVATSPKVGTSLVLGSRILSILYFLINFYMGMRDPDSPFRTNSWLRWNLFGVDLEQCLRLGGMLLACGVLKTLNCISVFVAFNAFTKTTRAVPVAPAANLPFDSQASSIVPQEAPSNVSQVEL
jgi:hypothetical protein